MKGKKSDRKQYLQTEFLKNTKEHSVMHILIFPTLSN